MATKDGWIPTDASLQFHGAAYPAEGAPVYTATVGDEIACEFDDPGAVPPNISVSWLFHVTTDFTRACRSVNLDAGERLVHVQFDDAWGGGDVPYGMVIHSGPGANVGESIFDPGGFLLARCDVIEEVSTGDILAGRT